MKRTFVTSIQRAPYLSTQLLNTRSYSLVSTSIKPPNTSSSFHQKRSICRAVFVKGLAVGFSEEDVAKYFSVFGELEDAAIFLPHPSMKAVTLLLKFKHVDSAISCHDELAHSVLAGRRVFVQYCQYSPESDAVREMLRIKAYVNPYPKKNNPSREADEKMAAGILK